MGFSSFLTCDQELSVLNKHSSEYVPKSVFALTPNGNVELTQ